MMKLMALRILRDVARNIRGVVVQIKNEEKRALYTHCYAHSIQLAVGDTMKASPVLKHTIANTYELTKLVKKVTKTRRK